MTRSCQSCGTTYDGERWQKVCWTCWRKRKDADDADRAYQRGYAAGHAAAARAASPRLDGDLLKAIIALCHPDRHPAERAADANAVTALLLNMREELAA